MSMGMYSYFVVSILNKMFKMGTNVRNENTFSHCDKKFNITAQVRYLR